MKFLAALLDAIGRGILALLQQLRSEQALRDLGRAASEQEVIRKAETDEKRARDAMRIPADNRVPDPRDRAKRRVVDDR